MIKPAIVAVGYNRPASMKRLLDSVCNAFYPVDGIDLIISIDKSDICDEVKQVADSVEWKYGNKTVRTFGERQGLRKHVIQCGDLSEKYEAVIILEDDLIVSPSYYSYTYNAVNYYTDDRIAGIALYSHGWNGYANTQFIPEKNEYDVFMGQFSITWGQCWTRKNWNSFKKWYSEHEDKLPNVNDKLPIGISNWSKQSWGKYFISYMVETDKYYVIPYTSMTTNFAEIGQHNDRADSSHQVQLMLGVKKDYSFCEFEQAVKYDVFFERKYNDDYFIHGIEASKICMDLNGIKPNTGNCQFVLIDRSMPLELVTSFALRMHPVESNITMAIKGDDLYLYKCPNSNYPLPCDKLDVPAKRRNYELYGTHWKALLKEGISRFLISLKRKFRK